MIKAILFILVIFCSITVDAQIIKGIVTDKQDNPLPGANVFIEGSYDGASTDQEGKFSFETKLTGKHTLIVRYIGFLEYKKEIDITPKGVDVKIVLRESSKNLNAVVITAGSFEASDEKKGVVMKPLDVVTTAGGMGDIYGAMNTLPGTQLVGEEGKVFVRGGDSYETKTFFDGMRIEKPYYERVPDFPTRGRFSPWLFSGTVFSSGGYSAEYGQALSSALILKSEGLAEQDISSISLMSIGLGGSHTKRWDNTSLSVSGEYVNMTPYYGLIGQKYDWDIAPRGYQGSLIFRQKAGKEGLLKAYGSYEYGRSKINYPDINNNINEMMSIDLKEYNGYFNSTYNGKLSKKWLNKAGFSYSYDRADYEYNKDQHNEKVRVAQAKYNVTYLANDILNIKFGGDFLHKNYYQRYLVDSTGKEYKSPFIDNLTSAFTEAELTIGPKFAARIGGRFEYSSWLNKTNLAPRLSLAFKTGKKGQISLAYGDFYQTPEDEYIMFDPGLSYEKATHYILNYQIMKNKRIFRVETYYKDYDNLITYDSLYSDDPDSYDNTGHGYAYGVDVFWRDESIDYLDYWISYAFIDTERDYLDFEEMATPIFVSKHNARAVVKYFIVKINTQLGLTYTFASGRPYENPNSSDFLSDKTKAYHDLSFNFSFLTELWNNFTIIYFSIGNVFGRDNVYGYHYTKNSSGKYERMAIGPQAKRFLFLGLFISFTE